MGVCVCVLTCFVIKLAEHSGRDFLTTVYILHFACVCFFRSFVVCVIVCVSVGLLRVYVLISSVVLSLRPVVSALQPELTTSHHSSAERAPLSAHGTACVVQAGADCFQVPPRRGTVLPRRRLRPCVVRGR